MLARSTWAYLAVYAAYTAAHIAFLTPIGPPMGAPEPTRPTEPDGLEVAAVRMLPGDDRMLVGVRRGGEGRIWVLRPKDFFDWASGIATFPSEPLGMAEMTAKAMPEQIHRDGDAWTFVLDEEGPVLVRWSPPAAPVRSPLPRDVAWVKRDGSPVTTAQLDAALSDGTPRSPRAMPGFALVSGALAVVRLRAPDGPGDSPRAKDDDFVVFDVETAGLRATVETVGKTAVVAATRFEGFFQTGPLGRRLELFDCERRACELRFGGEPDTGVSAGGIARVDASLEQSRAALCTGDGRVMLYRWSPGTDDTALLGEGRVDGRCTSIAVSGDQILVGTESGAWQHFHFAPRSALLR